MGSGGTLLRKPRATPAIWWRAPLFFAATTLLAVTALMFIISKEYSAQRVDHLERDLRLVRDAIVGKLLREAEFFQLLAPQLAPDGAGPGAQRAHESLVLPYIEGHPELRAVGWLPRPSPLSPTADSAPFPSPISGAEVVSLSLLHQSQPVLPGGLDVDEWGERPRFGPVVEDAAGATVFAFWVPAIDDGKLTGWVGVLCGCEELLRAATPGEVAHNHVGLLQLAPRAAWLEGTPDTAQRVIAELSISKPAWGERSTPALLEELGNGLAVQLTPAAKTIWGWQTVGLLALTAALTAGWVATTLRQRRQQVAQRRSEDRRRESERRSALLTTHAPVGIFRADACGRVTFVNPSWCTMADLSPAAARGEGWLSAVHAESREAVAAAWRDCVESGGNFELEFRFQASASHAEGVSGIDGDTWVFAQAIPEHDPAGVVCGFVGTVTDISRRRRAERALLRSEHRLRGLFETIADGLAIHRMERDPSGAQTEFPIVEVNPALCGWLGPRAERAGGIRPSELLPSLAGHWQESLRRAACGSEPQRFEEYCPDIERHLEFAIYASGDDGLATVLRDLTATKRAESQREQLSRQLRHAQKMEAVGQLAGGVAHDFNNLLTAMLGHTQMVKSRAEKLVEDAGRDELLRGLHQVEVAINCATVITRKLLAFGRRDRSAPELTAVQPAIVALREILERLIQDDIALELCVADGVGALAIDPGDLEQIVLNLVLNAADAIYGSGRITIECERVVLGARDLRRDPRLRLGPHVRLVVRDDGSGMDAETLSHIFEPFFTTKPIGQGTGLGLATVYGIVEQFGGHVEVESEPGRGTSFTVHLPAAAEAAPAEAPLPCGDDPCGDETVLVCEDQSLVRDLATRVLGSHGYRVLEAEDGRQALELLDRGGREIDLLVSDVVMPGLGGVELAEVLRQRHSQLAVVFISGYAADSLEIPISEGDFDTPPTAFLEKPFDPMDLLRTVRRTLDALTIRS